jgi:serine/threonine-protein kinase HipA
MTMIEVWLDDAGMGQRLLVGQLTRTTGRGDGAIRFEYALAWLASDAAFALDHDLPLVSGPHHAPRGAGELTGAFLDCSPDRWGKMLMERREAIVAREQGRRVQSLRTWHFLLGVNDASRMGALRLKDPSSDRFLDDHGPSAPPVTSLRELEVAADQVERDGDAPIKQWILQLIAPGASLGGARPKACFRDHDGSQWLAKFPSREDRRDVGLWEYLTHELSLRAGIDAPPARALKLSDRGHTFAVRRFDRAQAARATSAIAGGPSSSPERSPRPHHSLGRFRHREDSPSRPAPTIGEIERARQGRRSRCTPHRRPDA